MPEGMGIFAGCYHAALTGRGIYDGTQYMSAEDAAHVALHDRETPPLFSTIHHKLAFNREVDRQTEMENSPRHSIPCKPDEIDRVDSIFEMTDQVSNCNGTAPVTAIMEVLKAEGWKLSPSTAMTIVRKLS